MKTRLQYIVKNEGLTNNRFATEIGISPAAVTHIISGRNNPSLEIISKIAARYPNYSLRWLILGELPILSSEAENTPKNPEETPVVSQQKLTTLTTAPDSLPFNTPDEAIDSSEQQNPTTTFTHQAPTTPTEQPQTIAQDNIQLAQKPSALHYSDRLIVCFPDGTFREYTKQ
ncbi:MAG: helix-turn-helix transcriptional regulator [Tidjanibacter sp.]|nr:helix-turn-helix transcriptional regulator [Tidjanibacter sp.]